MIHTVKGFSVINETDVYLEFLFFLYDPFNVSNLNSGFFAFSKPSLYILKFSIQVLLKPSWKDLGHNLTSMGSELNCPVVWTFFSTALLGNWMNTDLFQSCGHFWVFQICWHIECSILIASSFRILNSPAFWLLLLFSQAMSNSLQLHGLQHARTLCPSPSPGVFPSSCPLNWWWHQTISSSVTLFSFCLQSFPA